MGPTEDNDLPARTGSTAAPLTPRLVAFRDRWVRRNRALHLVYRSLVAVVGATVVVIGIILLPLPGPGWLVIFLGLGILASEFAWARRLLDLARSQVRSWTAWLTRQGLVVRALVAAATLAGIAAAVGVYAWLFGLPDWVPLLS